MTQATLARPTEWIKGDLRLVVEIDNNPESPRERRGNIGILAGYMNTHDIFEHRAPELLEMCNQEWFLEMIGEDVIYLPVYAYTHAGSVSLSTDPFNEGFDAAEVGVIYATRREIRKRFGWKKVSDAREAFIQEEMRTEVDEFDHFLNTTHYRFKAYENGKLVDEDDSYIYDATMVDSMAENWDDRFDVFIPEMRQSLYPMK